MLRLLSVVHLRGAMMHYYVSVGKLAAIQRGDLRPSHFEDFFRLFILHYLVLAIVYSIS